jgi:thymidine kinase
MFPGSARLIELADRVEWLQLRNLCWCGERATHNARKVNGVMVTSGDILVLGDTDDESSQATVSYEVLCRRHHMRRELAPR